MHLDFKLFGLVTQDGFGLSIWISFAMDLHLDMELSLAKDWFGF